MTKCDLDFFVRLSLEKRNEGAVIAGHHRLRFLCLMFLCHLYCRCIHPLSNIYFGTFKNVGKSNKKNPCYHNTVHPIMNNVPKSMFYFNNKSGH